MSSDGIPRLPGSNGLVGRPSPGEGWPWEWRAAQPMTGLEGGLGARLGPAAWRSLCDFP